MPPQIRERLALCACGFFSAASVRATDTLIPVFAREFAVSIGTASTLLTGFLLAYGLMQWVFGPLAQHHGTVRVMLYALAGSTLMNLGVALADSYHTLLVFRTLAGASAAGIVPLCLARIAETVPLVNRQSAIARFSLATITGLMAGQWMAGRMADTVGWRVTFVILSCGFLISLLALRRHSPTPPAMPKQPGTITLRYVVTALQSPGALSTLGLTTLLASFGSGVLSFVVASLRHTTQMTLSDAGLLTVCIGAGGLLYAAFAPKILERTPLPRLALCAGVLLCMALTSLAVVREPWQVALACLAAGPGYYAALNIMQTAATEFAPDLKPTAVTLFASCLFCTQALAVLVWGQVVDRLGFPVLFVIGGCGALLFGLLLRGFLTTGSPLSARVAPR
ncbi:MFS transporter [Cupriavidus sp. 2SB]|uniref:MFS transporter n=1 Tax=Cupriavidus sp. 2SB TaxID=2502199 RepID=UPI0010F49214|nr:MFS transporter [Cupriavidus sp. 2SB]